MLFSPFETFYPRHVQDPITLAVCENMSVIFTPLERLIHILSNGVTNFNFLDKRPISLEHVTYVYIFVENYHPKNIFIEKIHFKKMDYHKTAPENT